MLDFYPTNPLNGRMSKSAGATVDTRILKDLWDGWRWGFFGQSKGGEKLDFCPATCGCMPGMPHVKMLSGNHAR